MKKFLAVLLAVLMIFSVMSVAVFAVAEGDVAGTTVVDDSGDQKKDNLPDWLVELIARIKQVIAKILFKLGIKWSWAL